VIEYQGESDTFKNLKGFRYIKQLIQTPDVEIPVELLCDSVDKPMPNGGALGSGAAETAYSVEPGLSEEEQLGSGIEMTDKESIKEYRRHIEHLKRQIEDAEELGDDDKKHELEDELDTMRRHVTANTNYGGQPRKVLSAKEKQRKRVQKSIKAAIEATEDTMPRFHRHLSTAITTGATCRYVPESGVEWQ
jgi:hypothetical protein